MVDNDLRKRLRSTNWAVFDETVAELEVGVVLERLGFSLDPWPMARRGRQIGEWLARKEGRQIFIEVKTKVQSVKFPRTYCGGRQTLPCS